MDGRDSLLAAKREAVRREKMRSASGSKSSIADGQQRPDAATPDDSVRCSGGAVGGEEEWTVDPGLKSHTRTHPFIHVVDFFFVPVPLPPPSSLTG